MPPTASRSGEEEVKLTKRAYGWPEDAKFLVPDGVYDHFQRRNRPPRQATARRLVRHDRRYKAKHPDLADQLYRIQHRQLPDGWDKDLPVFPADPKGMATRVSSGKVLERGRQECPLVDRWCRRLGPVDQDLHDLRGRGRLSRPTSYGGRNFHFGVREHAMGAIMNGMALVKVRAVRRGLLDLQRVRPDADPPGGLDGDPGHLRLHARLDRRRRRRSDPPAGRTACVAASDPRHDRHPARATPTKWSRPGGTS